MKSLIAVVLSVTFAAPGMAGGPVVVVEEPPVVVEERPISEPHVRPVTRPPAPKTAPPQPAKTSSPGNRTSRRGASARNVPPPTRMASCRARSRCA